MDHNAQLTIGRNWTLIPTCSCGWSGHPTYDKGEATRAAYAHAIQMERPTKAMRQANNSKKLED